MNSGRWCPRPAAPAKIIALNQFQLNARWVACTSWWGGRLLEAKALKADSLRSNYAPKLALPQSEHFGMPARISVRYDKYERAAFSLESFCVRLARTIRPNLRAKQLARLCWAPPVMQNVGLGSISVSGYQKRPSRCSGSRPLVTLTCSSGMHKPAKGCTYQLSSPPKVYQLLFVVSLRTSCHLQSDTFFSSTSPLLHRHSHYVSSEPSPKLNGLFWFASHS